MHPIAPYARTAYAMGWAASGGPMTDRVKAGSRAAVQIAIEHEHEPDVLEATLHLGHLEGVWARIFERRTRLYNEQVARVAAIWKPLALGMDLASVVSAIRSQASNAQESTAPAKVATAAALILNALQRYLTAAQYQALRNQVIEGVAAAEAEGYTDALALLADQLGHVGFAFDDAYQDAEDLFGDEIFSVSPDQLVDQLLTTISTDLGRALAAMAETGASAEEMLAYAESLVSTPQFRPLVVAVDNYVHAAITRGILALYRAQGVPRVWWITAADNTVCPACDQLEADSPYSIADCPQPPEHVNCRCSLYTEDPLPGGLVSKYVD